jgi:Na+/pantothenate symporter
MQISLSISDYVVMAGYLVGLVVIGFFCSSSKKDSKAYLLGGGKMPYFALGISCLMAALSAFSLVMVPGEIFNHGLSYWVLGLLTPLFTVVTCSIFMRFYFKIGAFTPFEYLERRYSPEIRTLVASLTIYLDHLQKGFFLTTNHTKRLSVADAHNPFFVHGKHGKRGKFVGLLLRRMEWHANL